MTAVLSHQQLKEYINKTWDENVIPAIKEFIAIPNVSPSYDKLWASNGLLQRAAEFLFQWIDTLNISGLKKELLKGSGKTPLIFVSVEGPKNSKETVLMYGHLDKQPPFTGWSSGLGPYTPVIREGKLYGRGAADDGYSIFSALTAVKALQLQNILLHKVVVIIEACEESGSFDLPYYIDKLSNDIKDTSLVVCLDSGTINYETMSITASLRGNFSGELSVQIMEQGAHSGAASGIVPDPFRILRTLFDRIQDNITGEILISELYVDIPEHRKKQVKDVARIMNEDLLKSRFTLVPNGHMMSKDIEELLLNNTWRPTLTVVGAADLPQSSEAGNVLLPKVSVKLSFRLPPTANATAAVQAVKRVLEKDPPYGAKVSFISDKASDGWNAPLLEPWLSKAIQEACNIFYDTKLPVYLGEGGSIPFMSMLGRKFPNAQFCVTGVLGPQSNAHGPNEFLHIDYAKRLTCCISQVLHAHYCRLK